MKLRFVYAKNVGPDRKKGLWRWLKAQVIGQGIVLWTGFLAIVRFDWKSLRFNFRHVEVWFPDEDGEFIYEAGRRILLVIKGQMFSSTTRGDATGVRFAPASEVLKHPSRWMYQEFEVDAVAYRDMYLAAQSQVGKKYDYLGLFTGFFLLAPYLQNDNERYCSDVCGWLAWIGGMLKKRFWILSPRRLAKIMGGELHELKGA